VSDVVTSPIADIDAPRQSLLATVRDAIALGKPRIAVMTAIVGGGTWLLAAPTLDSAALWRGALGMLGVTLIVMGAGAFNMLLERDVDTLMTRTKDRPVAARRVSPTFAFLVALMLTVTSLPLLLLQGNPLTLGLAMLSLFLYVLVYTPMKRTSPWSLVVGAIPGAMPALMGSTLATGRLEVTGLALFAIAFLWQIPHFLAISLYREREYVAAGHKVFPTSVGVTTTKTLILATTAPLCALGFALWPLGIGGPVFAFIAVLVGVWFTVVCAQGFAADDDRAAVDIWARKAFVASLVWQTVLFGALAADHVLFALFGTAA
jgi:protoheme IX farnesyltransferase